MFWLRLLAAFLMLASPVTGSGARVVVDVEEDDASEVVDAAILVRHALVGQPPRPRRVRRRRFIARPSSAVAGRRLCPRLRPIRRRLHFAMDDGDGDGDGDDDDTARS